MRRREQKQKKLPLWTADLHFTTDRCISEKNTFQPKKLVLYLSSLCEKGVAYMKHVKTLNTKRLQNTVKKGGCGECQTSCQSACKTSCTVGNQSCEHSK